MNKGNADNKVYYGIKEGKPQYTGITKQTFDARLNQHNRNGKGFSYLKDVYPGQTFTRNQARALEQYDIVNGPNALNKINSISPNRKHYDDAMNSPADYIRKHRR